MNKFKTIMMVLALTLLSVSVSFAQVSVISGNVATCSSCHGSSNTEDLVMNLSGTAEGVTPTDANGDYAFVELGSGDYTVTPPSISSIGLPHAWDNIMWDPASNAATVDGTDTSTGNDFILVCEDNICPAEAECGEIDSGCGGVVDCGTCSEGETCTDNLCAQGTTYGGIYFSDGDVSFADEVVSFDPGTFVVPPYDEPLDALGPPDDLDDENGLLCSLGNGGTLILEFTDNYLTTSGNSDEDLAVFEVGSVVEVVDVYISTDNGTWISVGSTSGSTAAIDIDAYPGVVLGEEYYFVKIIDNNTDSYSEAEWAGADIDAVGVINPLCVPDTTECSAESECGVEIDECGGEIVCDDTCGDNETCTDNICGPCVPDTTECSAESECGVEIDECGGEIVCDDTCGEGETCTDNICEPCVPETQCTDGFNCGTEPDGCGGEINCGTCGEEETCTDNICVEEGFPEDNATTVLDLEDYELFVWDFSGNYEQSLDNATLTYSLAQDAKGKLTGSGKFQTGDNSTTIDVDVKGKVKLKKDMVTVDYKVKGKNAEKEKIQNKYKLALTQTTDNEIEMTVNTLDGTQKGKINKEKIEGEVSLPVADDMDGDAFVQVVIADENGYKDGKAQLLLSNDDLYDLEAKGKFNSKKGESKYQLKGDNETTKGIKLTVTIGDNETATNISGKALGQKLKYKQPK